jgi:DNA-binding IclR family transcriptional regulator
MVKYLHMANGGTRSGRLQAASAAADGIVAEAREKRGVQSVETGYRILRAVQDQGRAVALGDIARRVGLTASAVHNYLVSLQRTGLIQSDGRGSYRIGPAALSLGLVALRQIDGFDIARAGAEALRDSTGLVVILTVWRDEGPVVVFKQDGLGYASLDIRPGMLLTPLGSAAGRAFIACLDPAVTAGILARHDDGDPAAQAEEVRRLRLDFARRGHARQDLFGHVYGYRALAAPIWDDGNQLRYVLVAMVPLADFAAERGEAFADALMTSARDISAMLGASGGSRRQ